MHEKKWDEKKRDEKQQTGKRWTDGVWKGNTMLPASFTIEASLLVPLVLAVIFLLLQIILYFHDTVVSEAWLYQETWKLRWNEEQDEIVFAEESAPNMAVLRYDDQHTTAHWNDVRREAVFQARLLPQFVTVIFQGQPEYAEKRSGEKIMRSWQFLRIAGAIIEEWEE